MTLVAKKKKRLYIAIAILCLISLLYAGSGWILSLIGGFLVVDEGTVNCDAVVVLNTGLEYYPRLMEAADVYKQGHVKAIVINGNRKSDSLRDLERMGFESCCPWYEESIRILELLGVPRVHVVPISAEDAYDTVSEARKVGDQLIRAGLKEVILTTSKYHTRRARFIWVKMYGNNLKITIVPAKSDPYDPGGWWKSGRQIRWVMAEYGAWAFYLWKVWLRG